MLAEHWASGYFSESADNDMPQYFDIRENRYKPVPDCSRVGLFWDANSQRCERSELLGRVVRATRVDNPLNQGLGFLWFDDYDTYYESGGGDSFWDRFGADGDYIGGGAFGYDLPYYEMPSYFDYWPSAGIDAGNSYDDYQAEYFYNQILNPYAIDYGYGFAQTSPDSSGGSGWDSTAFWDWVTGLLQPSPVPSTDWQGPQPNFDYGSADIPLPGYCPQGTYHPQNDPYACVPFPNDPAAKKQAQQQQKQQQAAARAAQAAQKKQDQSCPSDPQRRPVWRNPQTGKCELVPQCPPNTKFDSTTRRCLTPVQTRQIYGDNSWLWWLLGGGVVLLLATRDRGGRRR